jgi:hypothetical protein
MMNRRKPVIAALLLVAAYIFVPLASAGEGMRPPRATPQIIAFDNEDFLGDHIHILGNMKDLGKWNNSISSMIILSGTWEFFDDDNFGGTKVGEYGPGKYPNVAEKGIKNNSISSIRLASPGRKAAR